MSSEKPEVDKIKKSRESTADFFCIKREGVILEKRKKPARLYQFLNFCELIGFWQQTETEQITEAERRFDE